MSPTNARPVADEATTASPLSAPTAAATPNGTRSAFTGSLLASLALALLSTVTAIGFCRVFAGWQFLGPMLTVVLGVHLCCALLRMLAAPAYIAIPATLAVLFVLLAWKYYPDTMTGPLPGSLTWSQLLSDLRLVREQFPSAVAPVSTLSGFAVLATAATALAAMLSDAFAFRAYGRAEAVVPTAVLFLFAAALGADRDRVAVTAAWLACALAAVAILRLTHARAEHSWIGSSRRAIITALPVAVVLAGCAAASGAWFGPRLPGAHEKGLIDTSQHNDVTQVLSPLVDIRSRLVDLSDTELFTVAASEPNYWRVTGLSLFDGSTWKLPDGDIAAVSGGFAGTPSGSHEVVQQIHIAGLAGSLLPAAYSPVRIEDGSVYWVRDTGTLVVPNDGLRRAANYTVVSAVLDTDANELNASTSLSPPGGSMTGLPVDFPLSAAQAATEVTAGATTVYGKALALQNWFRTQFTYDLTVQRGHSDDALVNFLRTRRGYCEQFSGAFAAMARSLGIPARVAVGFTSGDVQADGRYHVFGRNAHAWPEVWFDSVGWVAFEPTPGRGQPGNQQYTGVEPQQVSSDGSGLPTPVTAPTPTAPTGSDAATTTTTPAASTSVPAGTTPPPTPGENTSGAAGGTPPWIMLLGLGVMTAALWALALPHVLRRRRAGHADLSPVQQTTRSWQRATRALAVLGLAPLPQETPLEHAERVGRAEGLDPRMLHELADVATAAEYGDLADAQSAQRSVELADQVVQTVRDLIGSGDRIKSWFDPRLAVALLP